MLDYFWEWADPGFFAPAWLAAGALIVVLLVWLEARRHALRQQAIRLFAAPHLAASLVLNVSPVRRALKALLLLCAAALLFVALARPYLFYDWTDEKRSGLDVLLAVDCSKSMLTEDVIPNRLERAKLAIADFAAHLPSDRLGLIAFAGDAFLQCPLTLDHDAFLNAVNGLDTDSIPRPGTDIATAIGAAADALHSQPDNLKFLILISDGEDLEGRVLDAARNAARNGLKIYTVGVGTPEGDRIPEHDNGYLSYHHDPNGNEVISRLDENTLQRIADITGGAYVPLGQNGDGLEQIYTRYLAPLPRQNLQEKRQKIHIERFEWPLGAAIVFLMWEFLISERTRTPKRPDAESPRRLSRGRAAPVAPASVAVLVAFMPLHAGDLASAQREYQAADYDRSMQDYETAAQACPARAELQFDRGDAAYRAGEFSEAEEAFRQALLTPNLNLQEQSYYNLGNTQYEHGAALLGVDRPRTIQLWKAALHSYECALKLKTASDTQHNYEVVKRKLEELQQQQQQDQNQSSSGSGQGKSGAKGQPSDSENSGATSGNGANPGNGENSSASAGAGTQNEQASRATTSAHPNLQTYSNRRGQDETDPQIRSRQDAANLLDSLQDEEHHITARNYTTGGTSAPPPSGKDW